MLDIILKEICRRFFVVILIISLFSSTIITSTRGNVNLAENKLKGRTRGGNSTQVKTHEHTEVKRSPISSLFKVPFVSDRSFSVSQDKAESRGHQGGHGHGHGWGWGPTQHYYQQHDNNMDLYSLLGGLSFASLLGATIIFLARRNTSGRRRRSIDSIFDDEDEAGPETLILNAIEYPKY